MANTATTFSDYFDGLPNPFVPPAAQYDGFAAVPAIQPQGILASLESTQYPSVLMASRTDEAPVSLSGSILGGDLTRSGAANQQVCLLW